MAVKEWSIEMRGCEDPLPVATGEQAYRKIEGHCRLVPTDRAVLLLLGWAHCLVKGSFLAALSLTGMVAPQAKPAKSVTTPEAKTRV